MNKTSNNWHLKWRESKFTKFWTCIIKYLNMGRLLVLAIIFKNLNWIFSRLWVWVDNDWRQITEAYSRTDRTKEQ
jgi:hypothetical protein